MKVVKKWCAICAKSFAVRDVKFHVVPKNERRRQRWIDACGFMLTENSFACEKHFKEQDFCQSLHKRLLMPGAVPSLHMETPKISQDDMYKEQNEDSYDDIAEFEEDPGQNNSYEIRFQSVTLPSARQRSKQNVDIKPIKKVHPPVLIQSKSSSTLISNENETIIPDIKKCRLSQDNYKNSSKHFEADSKQLDKTTQEANSQNTTSEELQRKAMKALNAAKHFMQQQKESQTGREVEFCKYLCCELKKIKSEETFDDLKLDILQLVRNTVKKERMLEQHFQNEVEQPLREKSIILEQSMNGIEFDIYDGDDDDEDE